MMDRVVFPYIKDERADVSVTTDMKPIVPC